MVIVLYFLQRNDISFSRPDSHLIQTCLNIANIIYSVLMLDNDSVVPKFSYSFCDIVQV